MNKIILISGSLLLFISLHGHSTNIQPKSSVCVNNDYNYNEPDEIDDGYDSNQKLWKEFNTSYQNEEGRKLAVFMDGTRNNGKDSTNIRILYRMAIAQACQGFPIIPYYDKGVGTHKSDQFFGSAFGSGISRNIQQAYQFLSQAYKKEEKDKKADDIYIFGFSRGALTARSLNGFIEFAGLLNGTSMSDTPPHWWPLPAYAFQAFTKINFVTEKVFNEYRILPFREDNFENTFKEVIKNYVNENFQDLSFQKVEVKVIGVFDTVPAVGFFSDDNPANHRINLYAKKGFHALSLDEQRKKFKLNRFNKEVYPNQQLTEVWFSGGHSDIGGGYPNSPTCNTYIKNQEKDISKLSATPLKWMLSVLEEENLFPQNGLEIKECRDGKMYDEYYDGMFGFYKLFGSLARKPEDQDFIHQSVVDRINVPQLTEWHPKREPNQQYKPINLKIPIEKYYKLQGKQYH